jgi:subtilisin family serine protease
MEAIHVMAALSETFDWGLQMVGVAEMHKRTKGAGIRVAVLDTGYATHDDLEENIARLADGMDHTDRQGHGTHVAGIVAAAANGFGVVGVAPEAQVVPIKVLGDDGRGGFAQIEQGIRKAIAHGVDIINMSLGSPSAPTESLHDAIRDANSKGIFVFAAAGNDAREVNYPARFDEVIAVAAMDKNGNMARFSSRGAQVAVGAPGVDIYSTHLNNQYAVMSGTSQACPFMAGVAALLLALDRSSPQRSILTHVDMLRALDELCDPHGRLGVHGKDGEFGYGIPSFANVPYKQ